MGEGVWEGGGGCEGGWACVCEEERVYVKV